MLIFSKGTLRKIPKRSKKKVITSNSRISDNESGHLTGAVNNLQKIDLAELNKKCDTDKPIQKTGRSIEFKDRNGNPLTLLVVRTNNKMHKFSILLFKML